MQHTEYYPPYIADATCLVCGAAGQLMVVSGCVGKFPDGIFSFVEDAPCDHLWEEALEASFSPLVYLWGGGKPGSCVVPLEVVRRWGSMGYTQMESLEPDAASAGNME